MPASTPNLSTILRLSLAGARRLPVVVLLTIVASSTAQAVPGREAWRQVIKGDMDYVFGDEARSVVVDSNGDVIAAGSLGNSEILNAEFTVIKFAGSTGAELWRQEVLSVDGSGGISKAVALDQTGDLIACGVMDHDLTVIKFDGDDGAELWREQVDGSAGFPDFDTDDGYSVAVDSNGNVIAAGTLENETTGSDFFVIKFNGATGAELWRQEIDASGSAAEEGPFSERVRSVAVDGGDDVVAVGNLNNADTEDDFAVMKFNGTTGAELWRYEIPSAGTDEALALTIDAAGNAIAGGTISGVSPAFRDEFLVVKVAGTSGEELWRTSITSTDYADAASEGVAVDSNGNVIAVGLLEPEPSFLVAKLAAADGGELWRGQFFGRGDARSVALDGNDDVLAGGASLTAGEEDFAVIKLSGGTGDEIWRHEIAGTGFCEIHCEQAHSIVVDDTGDVVAAGQLINSGSEDDFTVVKLLPEPSAWILRLVSLGCVGLLPRRPNGARRGASAMRWRSPARPSSDRMIGRRKRCLAAAVVLLASACATSAIVEAARQGDAARVDALIQEGHSGDSRSLDAALLAASLQGHADVVRVVLGHGAQVNARDPRGQSPLYLASWKGHRTAAETLLDGGAEIDARERNGWTPLMIGSAEGFSDIVEFLLERGANPNLRNVHGRTALHYAAMYGYSNIVERLLAQGTDAAIREEESGETPAMVAARFGHNDTAEILRRADATR